MRHLTIPRALLSALLLPLFVAGCADDVTAPATRSGGVDALERINPRYRGPNKREPTRCIITYDGCVKSPGTWRENPESWPFPFRGELQFCTVTGATYSQVFTADSQESLYLQLAQEYIAALLNKTYNNGSLPPDLQSFIDRAQRFFHERDPRVPLTQAEIDEASLLRLVLYLYNKGDTGFPPCAQ